MNYEKALKKVITRLDKSNIVWTKYGSQTKEELAKQILESLGIVNMKNDYDTTTIYIHDGEPLDQHLKDFEKECYGNPNMAGGKI